MKILTITLAVLLFTAGGVTAENAILYDRTYRFVTEVSDVEGRSQARTLFDPNAMPFGGRGGGIKIHGVFSHRSGESLILERNISVKKRQGSFYGAGDIRGIFTAFKPFESSRLEYYKSAPGGWQLLEVAFANEESGETTAGIIDRWRQEPPTAKIGIPNLLTVPDADFAAVVGFTPINPTTAATALQELIALHPDDLVYTGYLLDLLLHDSKVEEAEAVFANYETLAKEEGLSPEIAGVDYYAQWILARKWEANSDRPSLAELIRIPEHSSSSGEDSFDGEAFRQAILDIRADDFFTAERFGFYAPLPEKFRPSYLYTSTMYRVFRVRAELAFLDGRANEGVPLLEQLFLFSIKIGDDDEFGVKKMLGASFGFIPLAGIENIVLNLDDAEEVREHWTRLDSLEILLSAQSLETLRPSPTFTQASDMENRTRSLNLRAKTALTLSAIAIRHHQLATGEWPAPDTRLSLMPEGVSADPFRDLAGPLSAVYTPQSVRLYSVGPDGIDDGGITSYDPSNGTVSSGDVVLDIPRERRYPAKRGVPLPDARSEIMERFPNGLFPDPFADIRGTSYVITDETPSGVFSWGPVVDMTRGKKGPNYRRIGIHDPIPAGAAMSFDTNTTDTLLVFPGVTADVHYDPTNGILSTGDIRLR